MRTKRPGGETTGRSFEVPEQKTPPWEQKKNRRSVNRRQISGRTDGQTSKHNKGEGFSLKRAGRHAMGGTLVGSRAECGRKNHHDAKKAVFWIGEKKKQETDEGS